MLLQIQELSAELGDAERFRELSRSGQQLAEECTEDVVESLMTKLRQTKELYTQTQRSINERCDGFYMGMFRQCYGIVR